MHTLRQIVRQLLRRRTSTTLSVGLLALGVGLSVSFYSLLDRTLLSGLPFPGGDRMVALSTAEAGGWPTPLSDYREIESALKTFEWTYPQRTFNTMVTLGDRTRGVIGGYVPPGLFENLGVEPAMGRGFTAQDVDAANPSVVLLSHRLWRDSYGRDPEILGKEITLNRERCVVVGVMPEGFQFPLRHDVWGVFGRSGRSWEEAPVLTIGKLAPGVSLSVARQDLQRITALLDEERPLPEARNAAIETYVRANIGDRAVGALRAMVVAALVLLILTCANFANIRLNESLRRAAELETRLALGSGPLGHVKLVALECLLLGVTATVMGLALAQILVETLAPALLGGSYLTRIFWVDAGLDFRAAVFATLCALAASLLAALGPILSTSVRLRKGRFGLGTARAHTARGSRSLVSLQVGLCFTLLVAAGLWSSRAEELLDGQPGFRTSGLSSTLLSTYQANLSESRERRDLLVRLQRELSDSPKIVAAAYASAAPWGFVPRSPVVAGAGEPDPDTAPWAEVIEVSPSFFETLELKLLAGRSFSEADHGDERVAIVSRSLAQRLFDDRALDRSLTLGGRQPDEIPRPLSVIGVAADLDLDRTDDEYRNLTIYLPAQVPEISTFLLVRRPPGPGPAREVIEEVLATTAPLIGTLDELSVEQAVASSIWVERRLGQIFSLFALAAFLVTAGGIYAVVALMVRGRERELGIRAAVGARPGHLRRLVLGESGRQLAIGLVTGGVVLWLASTFLDRVLVEGLELRASILFAAAAVVALCGFMASWGPTRRAARTDPVRCLSSE